MVTPVLSSVNSYLACVPSVVHDVEFLIEKIGQDVFSFFN